ncbi:pirin family protein [Nocardia stercoris]|uniref:pirin family protein n=1 Tax=Nocardia stercoris TaxID=2483361 RepID=UPI0018F27F3E|nr:pirin-like bicupin family protein [Nocardia stercoris]
MAQLAAQVRVIRGDQRYDWRNEWLDSRQSFPFTGNFDLAAHAHGLLLVHNDDIVDPGEGFDSHQHRDMEIVTWVLEGSVVHKDSEGHSGVVYPGLAQRMSAGTGILHSERNGAGRRETQRLRVVQMWIPPDETGVAPSYQDLDISTPLAGNALVTVASGMPRDRDDAAVTIGNRFAALHVARLDPGRSVTVPDAPYGHVYVATGSVDFEGQGALAQGDAVRLTGIGGQRITATAPAEVLIWEMHAATR